MVMETQLLCWHGRQLDLEHFLGGIQHRLSKAFVAQGNMTIAVYCIDTYAQNQPLYPHSLFPLVHLYSTLKALNENKCGKSDTE